MGHQPSWFRVIQAARYLRVAPWDLAEQPLFWVEAAEATQNAEHLLSEHQENKRKGK